MVLIFYNKGNTHYFAYVDIRKGRRETKKEMSRPQDILEKRGRDEWY